MTASQKQAWFNLAVVALTVLTVVALVPVLGPRRAQGGFAWLSLMAFGMIFSRKRPGRVVSDERDVEIRRRSLMVAYAVFWAAFVFAFVGLPLYYGAQGAVPVVAVQAGIWVGWCIVALVDSVATLVQYGRGGSDAA